nr:EIICBA-Mtl [Candidatus Pantoea persica]
MKEDDDIEAATHRMQDMKAQSKGQAVADAPVVADANSIDVHHVRKIIVPATLVWAPA